MRILLTNIEMRDPSGTVSVIRDFALILKRRGNSVAVYATHLGPPAAALHRQGIPVVTDPAALGGAPDVIHGHHNIPAVLAMARFPNVPAVWFCHSRGPFDRPLPLEQIYRYVAVDRTRREILLRYGVPNEKVEILHNAVDLSRIPARPAPLPVKPKTAVSFSKHNFQVPTLEAACRSLGIAFSAFGAGVNRTTDAPEEMLARADIVFATGRSAIEALCCGAVVIVADARGQLGMVTTATYKWLRENNFGSGSDLVWQDGTQEQMVADIGRYDRNDAAKVTEMIRTDADLEKAADRLEQLYRDAIANRKPRWSSHDLRAAYKMLNNWPRNPHQKGLGEAEREKLAAALIAITSGTASPSP